MGLCIDQGSWPEPIGPSKFLLEPNLIYWQVIKKKLTKNLVRLISKLTLCNSLFYFLR